MGTLSPRAEDSSLEKIRELTVALETKEYELAFRERVMDRLLHAVPALIIIADKRDIRLASDAWLEATGWYAEELVGRPWLSFVHPEDVEDTAKSAREMTKGRIFNFKNRWRCKEGNYRRLCWNASSWDEDGLTYAFAIDLGPEE